MPAFSYNNNNNNNKYVIIILIYAKPTTSVHVRGFPAAARTDFGRAGAGI